MALDLINPQRMQHANQRTTNYKLRDDLSLWVARSNPSTRVVMFWGVGSTDSNTLTFQLNFPRQNKVPLFDYPRWT